MNKKEKLGTLKNSGSRRPHLQYTHETRANR